MYMKKAFSSAKQYAISIDGKMYLTMETKAMNSVQGQQLLIKIMQAV